MQNHSFTPKDAYAFAPLPQGSSRRATDPKISRKRMVDWLQIKGVKNPAVLSAMGSVPRHLFIQEALTSQAYEDTPLPIGHSQSISQPYIVAFMTELLEVQKGMRVLEIGTGSGYQAAILATLGCSVFTIERLRELHRNASQLLRYLAFRAIYTYLGDGTLGLPDAAPFDRIVITACGPQIPEPLIRQLDENGILLMPVGSRSRQRLRRLRKTGGRLVSEDLEQAIFVDLVGAHGR